MKKIKILAIIIACILVPAGSIANGVNVAPNLPDYERVSGVSGSLSSIGSDTLNNLMALWAEEFAKNYSNVKIQIQGADSSTAPLEKIVLKNLMMIVTV